MTAPTEPVIGISITATDLTPSGRKPLGDHHQYRVGSTTFIYFTPEQARQWIGQLQQITNEKESN